MVSIQITLFALLLWIKFHLAQNQCWSGYNNGPSWDYGQSYNYPYGQSPYDCNSYAPSVYISTYPQPYPYDYYSQPTYNPYPNDYQQPIVIVVNENDDDDWDWYDTLNLISNLKGNSDNNPVYVPYPVPVSCDCESDFGYSDCGCKQCGCGCSNSRRCQSCGGPYYDSGCNCDDSCGECRKRRPKSKCDRCGSSNSDCGCCSKCIKHRNDRCFRD